MEQDLKSRGLSIADLPEEIIKTIVDFVCLDRRPGSIRVISKKFFHIVDLRQFSLGLILPSEMAQLARVFGRYQKPIGLSFTKPTKLTTEDLQHLSALTQLTSLRILSNVLNSATLMPLTNLVSFESNESVFLSVCARLSKLTHLRATHIVYDTKEDTVELAQLASLEIKSNRLQQKWWPGLRCANLTSLTAAPTEMIDEAWFAPLTCLNELRLDWIAKTHTINCRLPRATCANLTSLSLTCIAIENCNDVPWHQLRSLSLQAVSGRNTFLPHLEQISNCTNLTSLSIQSQNEANLAALDVRKLTSLESFNVIVTNRSVKKTLSQLPKSSLTRLVIQLHDDYQECLDEIVQMTNLQSLHMRLGQKEGIDSSPLMTLTRLTSLTLLSNNKGLENITNLTRLNTLSLSPWGKNSHSVTLSLSSFGHLTRLASHSAQALDTRGGTRLQELDFDPPVEPSVLELVPEDMACLRRIRFIAGKSPSWTDLAKCTALECIETNKINAEDSISELQSLKYLTRLANYDLYDVSSCAHFDVEHLTCLTHLQEVEVLVPGADNIRQGILERMPLVSRYFQEVCTFCPIDRMDLDTTSK